MKLTRRARSVLADPWREFASVLTVMFLAFVVVAAPVLCSVHLDEAGHSSTHMDVGVGQHPTAAAVDDHHAADVAPGHHGEDPHDCSQDRTVTARYDRTLALFPDLAEAPDLAQQWLVPDMARDGAQVPSAGVVDAAAPSLHALGISRT